MKTAAQKSKPGRGMQQIMPRKNVYHRGHIEDNKYVFEDEDDDSAEEHPLKEYKPEPYLEKEIQPGDTLQTLSLQFNCPIAELKRLNNIHRDNEIFARRTIKVPMKLFTNKLVDIHSSSSQRETVKDDPCTSSNFTEIAEPNSQEPVSIQLYPSEDTPCAITQVSGDKTVVQDGVIENFDEDGVCNPLLLQEETNSNRSSIYSCSGADWGISWLQLLICSLLLGFAGPILYVIYITEDSKDKH